MKQKFDSISIYSKEYEKQEKQKQDEKDKKFWHCVNHNPKLLLKKDTILIHFVSNKNKNRNYRWYYLKEQETSCYPFETNIKNEYKTIKDVELFPYGIPCIINTQTGEMMNESGTYSSGEYKWDGSYKQTQINNNNIYASYQIETPKVFTAKCASDEYDPLRGIYLKKGDDIECISYEIVLPNNCVELIRT